MKVTTEQHLAALREIGELYPRSLMQAMQYAMNHLGPDIDSEPMADAEFREINLTFWTYINRCLGFRS